MSYTINFGSTPPTFNVTEPGLPESLTYKPDLPSLFSEEDFTLRTKTNKLFNESFFFHEGDISNHPSGEEQATESEVFPSDFFDDIVLDEQQVYSPTIGSKRVLNDLTQKNLENSKKTKNCSADASTEPPLNTQQIPNQEVIVLEDDKFSFQPTQFGDVVRILDCVHLQLKTLIKLKQIQNSKGINEGELIEYDIKKINLIDKNNKLELIKKEISSKIAENDLSKYDKFKISSHNNKNLFSLYLIFYLIGSILEKALSKISLEELPDIKELILYSKGVEYKKGTRNSKFNDLFKIIESKIKKCKDFINRYELNKPLTLL